MAKGNWKKGKNTKGLKNFAMGNIYMCSLLAFSTTAYSHSRSLGHGATLRHGLDLRLASQVQPSTIRQTPRLLSYCPKFDRPE
jgi:hypothetical protein